MEQRDLKLVLNQYNIEKIEENLNDFKMLNLIYSSAIKEVSTKLDILNEEFKLLNKYNPIEHIKSRIKAPTSIIEKLKRKNLDLSFKSAMENLHDIAGIRVVCSFIDDIYLIKDMLLKQNDVKLIAIKDYIKNPKESGYRSLHLIISIPIFLSNSKIDTLVEIQIRTVAMDFWASLEHKLKYKNEGVLNKTLIELKNLAYEINKMDERLLSIHQL